MVENYKLIKYMTFCIIPIKRKKQIILMVILKIQNYLETDFRHIIIQKNHLVTCHRGTNSLNDWMTELNDFNFSELPSIHDHIDSKVCNLTEAIEHLGVKEVEDEDK